MKKKQKLFKNNHAITLIALIVTIIILLILAGVTLSLIGGSEGILSRATNSVDKTNIEAAKEQVTLKIQEYQEEFYEGKYVSQEIDNASQQGDWIFENYSSGKTIDYEFSITKKPTEPGYTVEIQAGQNLKENIKGTLSVEGVLTWETDSVENGELGEDKKEESDEEIDPELLKYKKEIAKTLTELGVETTDNQTIDELIENIKSLANKNYEEGKESDIVLIKSNLSSRYEQTISLTNIEGYQNFDVEDFIIVNKNMLWDHPMEGPDTEVMTKSYDKQTGILTLGMQKSYVAKNSWSFWNTFDLYAIRRKIQEPNINHIPASNIKENLQDFKNKLAKVILENGIEDFVGDKTEQEISEYIKRIAKKRYQEGVATYLILIQPNLSGRYEQTVSISHIEGYSELTIDDFLIVNTGLIFTTVNDGVEVSIMSKSYNQDTGTLKFGLQKSYGGIYSFWNTYDVYLLKKEVINLE